MYGNIYVLMRTSICPVMYIQYIRVCICSYVCELSRTLCEINSPICAWKATGMKSSIQLVTNSKKNVHNLKKTRTLRQIVSQVIGIPRILYEKRLYADIKDKKNQNENVNKWNEKLINLNENNTICEHFLGWAGEYNKPLKNDLFPG